MKVNVASVLRHEGETAHYELEQEFPSLQIGNEELIFQTPVHVQLQVTNTGKSLLVKGNIQSKLQTVCGRCLETFIYPLDVNYEDEWVPSLSAIDAQEDNVLLFEKDEVKIDERIIEQILLDLPMKFICSPECLGLCPTCGVNRNTTDCDCKEEQIDPRLAKLADWNRGN